MAVSANVLLVAGGGGGGGGAGWWGGGGGFVETTVSFKTSGSYGVTVGLGWLGSSNANAQWLNGWDSSFLTVVAKGGGWGGSNFAGSGKDGGSGGGNASTWGTNFTYGIGTSGQGNNGWVHVATWPAYGSGGGGWANAAGSNGTSTSGGNGWAGKASSISGTSVYYAGGGGGSTYNGNGTAGTGGNGGGGNASVSGSWTSWTANTGGWGGGGASNDGGNAVGSGGDGGSGIVIIAYATGSLTATGGTVTTSGGNTIHTFTTSGTFTITSIPYSPEAKLGQAMSAGTSATSFLFRLDGDASDSSGNAVSATATNVVYWNWRNGANSAIGNGSSSLITTPLSSAINGTGAQTFGCWVKFASLPTSGNWMFLMLRGDIDGDWGFMLRAENVGWTTRLNSLVVSWWNMYQATWPAIVTDKWYYLVGKYASNSVKVYVDGSLIGTTATSGTLRTSASVGMQFLWLASGSALDGSMDEAFHETKDRSDAYIRKRYTYAVGRFATL